MNLPAEPTSSRGDVERAGLLLIAAGIVVGIVSALLVRWQGWGKEMQVEGWSYYYTYPWMWTAIVLGALISVVGVVTTLVGKAIR